MLEFAITLARQTGDYISARSTTDFAVEHKGRIDLVTEVDKAAQERIVSAIERRFPDHGIVAEEGYRKDGGSGYTWIIDPLDGTTNYVHRLPVYAVSLALYRGESPLLGVCYNPAAGELFAAETGKGATRNGTPITVSTTTEFVDALVATGFPYRSQNLEKITARFFRVVTRAQGVRRLGAAALDLCYVACGVFDAFWEEGLAPWDMAAGALILKEAGGRITNLDGSPFDLARGTVIASNSRLHDDLLRCME
ncbi:MAG TPA: inositol monophosphatase family protein [Deltaproteobacteria bacterium]|nr:inositol monophosphatase family protein [Deltaproteobacteria bacterium]